MSKDKSSSKAPESDDTTSDKLEDAVVFEADPEADSAHLASPAPAVRPGDSDVEADTDAVQIDDAVDEDTGETDPQSAEVVEETADAPPDESGEEPPPDKPAKKSRIAWFGLFNFLLILLLAAAAAWYWWQQQQLARDYEDALSSLEAAINSKATQQSIDSSLSPLQGRVQELDRQIDQLDTGQQNLMQSSEKLFELFGRDRNDWQLAEVEYLMRIAQHRLILQHDFDGAAITLQAASDRIGLTGDPGLLPVRVMISEEIADLKTRLRPDLVGMTLTLARLARQVRFLQPGFTARVETAPEPAAEMPPLTSDPASWLDRLEAFVDSLVEVRHETAQPTRIEAAIVDVSQTLEDNLKLARWAVLERDAAGYAELMEQSLRLFREFYDLDDAANADFMAQLQALQQTRLRPEIPDITGSLRELQRILSQREDAPADAAPTGTEASDG